jgi:uncharacterized membrane protein YraQ (UPF0718 family)
MKQKQQEPSFKKAMINSIKSFASILPVMFSIIGIVGIFQIYITPSMISSFFGYGNLADIFTGTLAGAVATGHGSISFIIAEGLKEQGVSLYALSTFTLAWVTLGLIQLPAEASVFGVKFTFYRNILAFFSTMIIAYLTIITIGLFS